MPKPIATSKEKPQKTDLHEPVWKAVENALNGLLDEEADPFGRRRALRTGSRP